MTIHALDVPMRIRVFQVTFRPSLDASSENDIRLGVFGDLQCGERYAVGLIARKNGTQDEIAKVGRLAVPLVAHPAEALKRMHHRIWTDSNPRAAFVGQMAQTNSSLIFLRTPDISSEQPASVAGGDIGASKQWCRDRLREELRRVLDAWMSNPALDPSDITEDYDMAA